MRKRHQHARHAGGGKFGDGGGAGTAHDQVRRCIPVRHVVDERQQFRHDPGTGVGLRQRCDVRRPRLMRHPRTRAFGQQRKCARHGLVEDLCPEAAAYYEQLQLSAAARKAFRRRGKGGDLGAHGIADQDEG